MALETKVKTKSQPSIQDCEFRVYDVVRTTGQEIYTCSRQNYNCKYLGETKYWKGKFRKTCLSEKKE